MRKITLCITGSIAAYKSIDLAKMLVNEGYEIAIVLSKNALNFIGYATFEAMFANKVYIDSPDTLFDRNGNILHIEIAAHSDLILIAPASANIISKLAHGMADCLISQICLASKGKIAIAPAMNVNMWHNSSTESNIKILESRHVDVIGPNHGLQACGAEGLGRMSEPDQIMMRVKKILSKPIFSNKRIMITAGPTIEDIDPIRFISNNSSGKMGNAIADIAWQLGGEVILITGKTAMPKHFAIKRIEVRSQADMLAAVLSSIEHCDIDIFISCAAVADYKPTKIMPHKIKKTSDNIILELEKTEDIVAQVKRLHPNIFCVGFAAETQDILNNGIHKLKAKNLDMIAINDVLANDVFDNNENELVVIDRNHNKYHLSKCTKHQIAEQLLIILHEQVTLLNQKIA